MKQVLHVSWSSPWDEIFDSEALDHNIGKKMYVSRHGYRDQHPIEGTIVNASITNNGRHVDVEIEIEEPLRVTAWIPGTVGRPSSRPVNPCVKCGLELGRTTSFLCPDCKVIEEKRGMPTTIRSEYHAENLRRGTNF